jgi:uncharacterized protein
MHRIHCPLLEVKFDPSEAETMTFEGYGAVFGNVDAYGDVIQPGAFASFLSEMKAGRADWPMMLSQHGAMGLTAEDITPVGVWTDFAEDGKGLRVKGQLATTPRGLELHTLMKMSPRPAIDGMSIGYVPKAWEPRSNPEDPKRKLTRIDLIEVSVVSRPANRLARVSAVKSIEELDSVREVELMLRDRGFTKTEAVALVAKIKGLRSGDPMQTHGGPGDPVAELAEALRRRGDAFKARA